MRLHRRIIVRDLARVLLGYGKWAMTGAAVFGILASPIPYAHMFNHSERQLFWLTYCFRDDGLVPFGLAAALTVYLLVDERCRRRERRTRRVGAGFPSTWLFILAAGIAVLCHGVFWLTDGRHIARLWWEPVDYLRVSSAVLCAGLLLGILAALATRGSRGATAPLLWLVPLVTLGALLVVAEFLYGNDEWYHRHTWSVWRQAALVCSGGMLVFASLERVLLRRLTGTRWLLGALWCAAPSAMVCPMVPTCMCSSRTPWYVALPALAAIGCVFLVVVLARIRLHVRRRDLPWRCWRRSLMGFPRSACGE